MESLYTAHVTSRGGREGFVRSSDGRLNLKLSAPDGDAAEGPTNPEQLFAAGYGACFHSAVKAVAKSRRLSAEDSEVTANVTLMKSEQEGYRLAVRLDVYIPGLSEEQTREIADKAHETCPYSKATRGDIDVEVRAVAHQTTQS